MTRADLQVLIQEVGILPALRVSGLEEALWVSKALRRGGIPIVELTMTVPGALDVLASLVDHCRDFMVGAGSILDLEMARFCAERGAAFLSSPGLDPQVVGFAVEQNLAIIPGVLTPTEVMSAWRLRPDFLRVFPCSQVGGASYIRALKGPFPQLPFIAAGGVNQKTAAEFIRAGAAAVSLGGELVPTEAVEMRDENRILELARRFLSIVRQARPASRPDLPGDDSGPRFRPSQTAVPA